MPAKTIITICHMLLITVTAATGQDYTSYFTGNAGDAVTEPSGGICLMGGSSEDNNAMRWFLERANGGDVLVLRTSGSDGYNNYMYSGLGVNINSVETIVCHSREASADEYILERIKKAEAIWFAGGNQWDYISFWRNTPLDSLINSGLRGRNTVIGGTSAGMAILGGFYFSAENGTVTSSTALNNPYDSKVKIDSARFITNSYLSDVITDTHYDNPDRKGRHMVFLARILQDYGTEAKGIACDEHTAVCIDTSGIASVYGQYPDYNDNAWFIRVNCELNEKDPEICSNGEPLTWNRANKALKVYRIRGDEGGSASFDLNNWETGSGGSWFDWYVIDGVHGEKSGTSPSCPVTAVVKEREKEVRMNISHLEEGIYLIRLIQKDKTVLSSKLIIK